MKLIIMFTVFLFCFQQSFSQGSAYYDTKDYLKAMGYTIVEDRYADIAQDETTSFWRTFYANTTYIIYGFSDDRDVNDLDLYVYYDDLDLYRSDNENDDTPIVTFTPSFTRSMKVVLKNYDSDTPYSTSRCRFFIAYK